MEKLWLFLKLPINKTLTTYYSYGWPPTKQWLANKKFEDQENPKFVFDAKYNFRTLIKVLCLSFYKHTTCIPGWNDIETFVCFHVFSTWNTRGVFAW